VAGSIEKNARVTSPASLSTIVQIAAADGLVAGEYEVVIEFYFAGTAPVDGTDSDNPTLAIDNVFISRLSIPAIAGNVQTYRFLVQTNGTNIKLACNNAGTVGAIYDATITATLVPQGTP
jgi:hypothetical protein